MRGEKQTIILKIIVFFGVFILVSSLLQLKPISQLSSKMMLHVFHFDYSSLTIGTVELKFDESQEDVAVSLGDQIADFDQLGKDWLGELSTTEPEVFIIKQGQFPDPILRNANGLFFPNTNIIAINGSLPVEERVHAFAHEYAHFYLNSYIEQQNLKATDLPDWFHEGVAEAFAHRFAPLPFYEAITMWEVVPFSEMDMKDQSAGTTERYIMAQFTVEKLLANHGDQVIAKLITETKEKDSFSKSFTAVTSQKLSSYHKYLERNMEFIENMEADIASGGKDSKVKQELLNYDDEQGPYYYDAPSVYSVLQRMYEKEHKWGEAISLFLKQRKYVRASPFEWKEASEYAFYMEDYERSEKYAEKAVSLTDERSEAEFQEWLMEVEKKSKVNE